MNKKMLLLKDEGNESCINQMICQECKIKFYGDDDNDDDHQNYTEKHRETEQRICNARQKTPKYIFGVFHNGSYYDYHFIIKVLMEVFEG